MNPATLFTRLPASQRGPLSLFVILSLVVLVLLILVWMTLRVQSGVRAYTQGESQWSKGRHQAVSGLASYIDTGNQLDWDHFEQGIAIPLADHRARLLLDSPDGDVQAIGEYFIQGRNHPDDVDTMIWLYRQLGWQAHFSRAIEAWALADQEILKLVELAEQIRARHSVTSSDLDQLTRLSFQHQLDQTNSRIIPLENAFSARIGEAARQVNRVLMLFLILVAVALVLIGGLLMRRLTINTFEAEQRFRQIFERAPVGIVTVAADGTWKEANSAMATMLGVTRSQLTGASARDFAPPRVRQSSNTEEHVLPPEKPDSNASELCYQRGDGSLIWIRQSLTPLQGLDGSHQHYLLLAEDVTVTRRQTRELAHRARHDALTGLVNRYEFERRLEHSIERAASCNLRSALLFLDLDHFKQINDSCGHLAGDEMLRNVASIIRGCVREQDTSARIGGDEFGVLLEACPPDTAMSIAEKIRDAISRYQLDWEGKQFRVGISIGVAPFSGHDQCSQSLLSRADSACYKAKNTGKNRICSADRAQSD